MIKLSVIIPTRNRAELLSDALISIKNQTIDQSLFEIIICDNNSTDKTAEIAKSFAGKFQNFKYIKTIEPGLHVGRNKGFQEARGDILVYADDDIEAFPEWLYTINEIFNNEDVVLVGGKNLPKWEIDPPEWASEMWKPDKDSNRRSGYFSIIDLGDKIKEISPYDVFGCNFSIRKKIIAKTKGFHPDGMPQEIIEYRGDGETAISDYIEKMGYKTIYHPKASIYHLVSKERLTVDYLRKRAFNQGVSNSYTDVRNSKNKAFKKPNSMLKMLLGRMLSFFRNKAKIEDNIYQKAIAAGYAEGYNFHQQKVKNSPELRAWVIKDNYL